MEPFRIDVPQADLDDLAERVRRTRWTPDLGHAPWQRGVPSDVLRELAAYWVDGYDWRAAEARINAVPGFVTEVDGQRVHLLHQTSTDPDAVPLLLTHGWPGSVVEFLGVLDPLTAPGPGAVHAVVPALPGYGWSSPLTGEGWSVNRIARAWIELMDQLGYERFAVQGGDWGSAVSRQVAVLAPERVVGLHLNMLRAGAPRDAEPQDETERRHLERRRWFQREGHGYNLLQGTKPDTIAHALADSPVGLLAWVVEKFHDWTDDSVAYGGIDRDTLLTDVTTYWLTNTAGSSAQLYWETYHDGAEQLPVTVPTAMAVFAHDILPAIRRFAEDDHHIVRWTEHADGGHFAALEQPEAFAADVRAFLAGL